MSAACLSCGGGKCVARGLCDTCYARHRHNGTLDQYPRLKPTGITHGKAGNYRGGCRCGPCCDANTTRTRAERLDRGKRRDQIPHGLGGYRNWQCRCPICVQASRVDREARRTASPVDPAKRGTPWTDEELALAARIDLTATEVARLTGRSYGAVTGARQGLPKPAAHRGRKRSAT